MPSGGLWIGARVLSPVTLLGHRDLSHTSAVTAVELPVTWNPSARSEGSSAAHGGRVCRADPCRPREGIVPAAPCGFPRTSVLSEAPRWLQQRGGSGAEKCSRERWTSPVGSGPCPAGWHVAPADGTGRRTGAYTVFGEDMPVIFSSSKVVACARKSLMDQVPSPAPGLPQVTSSPGLLLIAFRTAGIPVRRAVSPRTWFKSPQPIPLSRGAHSGLGSPGGQPRAEGPIDRRAGREPRTV